MDEASIIYFLVSSVPSEGISLLRSTLHVLCPLSEPTVLNNLLRGRNAFPPDPTFQFGSLLENKITLSGYFV